MVRLRRHATASKTFNGRKAAEDWARVTEDALRAGLAPAQESMTLEAVIVGVTNGKPAHHVAVLHIE